MNTKIYHGIITLDRMYKYRAVKVLVCKDKQKKERYNTSIRHRLQTAATTNKLVLEIIKDSYLFSCKQDP